MLSRESEELGEVDVRRVGAGEGGRLVVSGDLGVRIGVLE